MPLAERTQRNAAYQAKKYSICLGLTLFSQKVLKNKRKNP